MEDNKVTKTEEKKVWQIFACIGFGLGIGTIATFWIYSLALTSGPVGIVFSALGLKSNLYKGKARTGLILSIVGTVLAFIIAIIFIVAISFSHY